MPHEEAIARLDAATALRDLNHAFVAFNRDVDGLRSLQQFAIREADAMRSGQPRDRAAMSQGYFDSRDPDTDVPGDALEVRLSIGLEDRAVAGRANPMATPLIDIDYLDDGAVAMVTFGPACEGPPGRAHGGVVCAAFDDISGAVTVALKEEAFTGELTVRYVAPVPLNEELTITVRRDRREGRKLFFYEEMTSSEGVVATCHATLIYPRQSQT